MDCGIKCIKYLIFLFNILMLFAGIALIVAGVMIETMYKEYFLFLDGKMSFAAIFIIVVGCVIFVVSFFGCCGALRNSYWMIVIYTVLLTVVIIIQISLAISAFYMKDEIHSTLELKMKASLPRYTEERKGVYHTWNGLQRRFDCCGVSDYKDWEKSPVMGVNKVPDSCCINEAKGCGNFTNVGTINSQGCLKELKRVSEENVMLLALVAGIFAFIQITGIIFASWLAVALKRDYEQMK